MKPLKFQPSKTWQKSRTWYGAPPQRFKFQRHRNYLNILTISGQKKFTKLEVCTSWKSLRILNFLNFFAYYWFEIFWIFWKFARTIFWIFWIFTGHFFRIFWQFYRSYFLSILTILNLAPAPFEYSDDSEFGPGAVWIFWRFWIFWQFWQFEIFWQF